MRVRCNCHQVIPKPTTVKINPVTVAQSIHVNPSSLKKTKGCALSATSSRGHERAEPRTAASQANDEITPTSAGCHTVLSLARGVDHRFPLIETDNRGHPCKGRGQVTRRCSARRLAGVSQYKEQSFVCSNTKRSETDEDTPAGNTLNSHDRITDITRMRAPTRQAESDVGQPCGHARGRTQITPFGRGTGGHAGDQVGAHIGGSAGVLSPGDPLRSVTKFACIRT